MKSILSIAPFVVAGGALLVAAASSAKMSASTAGERAYQRCYSCHSLTKGEGGLTGPNLDRIVGSRIADDAGFVYSPAFRRFAAREKVWTRALLDRFIADPEAVVPDNDMQYFGMRNDGERATLVAYIAADR